MAKGKWKKEFNLLAEFVNNQVDADPNAVRLLSKLNGLKMDVPFKMKTIPKKSRQLSNGGFVMSVDRFTYECVKCELVIDQGMDGEHKLSNACRDIHEIGHMLDYINRKDKKVWHEYTGTDKELLHIIMNNTVPDDVIKHISSVNQEFQNLQQPILKQMDEINKKVSTINSQYTNGEIGRSEYDIMYDDCVKEFANKKNELLDAREKFFPQRQLSDIFDAISGGRIFDEGIGAGHGGKYYRDVTDRAKEIFANYFSLSIVGKKEIDYLRSVYPNLCDKMDSIIKMMGE